MQVGFPVMLHTLGGDFEAQIVDLSRTGLRLRLPAEGLNEEVRRAAERMAEVLAPTFHVDLHFKRLGPLLSKEAEPVRVSIPTDAQNVVEVACEFFDYLDDEEIGYLELKAELPELDESVEEWVPVAAAASAPPAESGGATQTAPVPVLRKEDPAPGTQPRQRYRALVAGMKLDAPPSFFCHTDMVTRIGVRVRLQRSDAGLPVGSEISVSEALATLVQRYGADLELRIVDSSGDIWSGPARFSGAELPRGHPEEVLATLAFGRPLTLPELRALGLVAAAG